jgi:hypothetical protein
MANRTLRLILLIGLAVMALMPISASAKSGTTTPGITLEHLTLKIVPASGQQQAHVSVTYGANHSICSVELCHYNVPKGGSVTFAATLLHPNDWILNGWKLNGHWAIQGKNASLSYVLPVDGKSAVSVFFTKPPAISSWHWSNLTGLFSAAYLGSKSGPLCSSHCMNGTHGPFLGIYWPGPFYDAYTAILIVALLIAIVAYIRRRPLSRGVTPRRHLIRNTSQGVMYLAVVGLFFAVMRYLQIQWLDMRLWTYLVILSAIAYAGYVVYFISEKHPVAVYHFRRHSADQRYRVQGRQRSSTPSQPAGRPATQRGKRRR